jgi:hypothetical protein
MADLSSRIAGALGTNRTIPGQNAPVKQFVRNRSIPPRFPDLPEEHVQRQFISNKSVPQRQQKAVHFESGEMERGMPEGVSGKITLSRYERDFIEKNISADELEISLGTFSAPLGGNGRYISGVPSNMSFEALLRNLTENDHLFSRTMTRDIVEIVVQGNDSIRRITLMGEDPRRARIEKKVRFAVQDNHKWGYRLSASEETLMAIVPPGMLPTYTRSRLRYTFTPVGNLYKGIKIDMSIVTSTSSDAKKSGDITYEVEIEKVRLDAPISPNELITSFSEALRICLEQYRSTIQDTQLLTIAETKRVIEYHNSLFPSSYPKGPSDITFSGGYWYKPTNLKIDDLLDERVNEYHVTIKYDGFRAFLLSTPDGVFVIAHPREVWKIGPPVPGTFGVLLDGEMFMKAFNAFDVVVDERDTSNGSGGEVDLSRYPLPPGEKIPLKKRKIPIDKKPFVERLAVLEQLVDILSETTTVPVQMKLYIKWDTIYESLEKTFPIYDLGLTQRVKLDGLIFQGPGEYKSDYTKKWKPSEFLTIDFLVDAKERKLKVYDAHFVVTEKLKTGKFVAFADAVGDLLNYDGQVVECKWDYVKGVYVFVRVRIDRNYPNALITAKDVERDIKSPIPRETLLGKTVQVFRRYHNKVKEEMLSQYAREANLLVDWGSGRGGQLKQWDRNKIKNVIAVEPNQANLDEFNARLNKMTLKTKIFIAEDDGRLLGADNTSSLINFVDGDPVDVVSAFFSLTYLSKSKKTFFDMIDSACAILGVGGKLIGAVMDGGLTKKILDDVSGEEGMTKTYACDAYIVTQKTSFSDTFDKVDSETGAKGNFGNAIEITVLDPENSSQGFTPSMVVEQTEWLFPFSQFVKSLKKRGFKLTKQSILDNSLLPKCSSEFSSLFKTFAFERVSFGDENPGLLPPPSGTGDGFIAGVQVPSGPSNILHAILRGCNDEGYLKAMEKGEQETSSYVTIFRATLAEKITFDLFLELDGGQLAGGFQRMILERGVEQNKDLLFERFMETFTKGTERERYLMSLGLSYIDVEKARSPREQFDDLMKKVPRDKLSKPSVALQAAFQHFVNLVRKKTEYLGARTVVQLASKYLNVTIATTKIYTNPLISYEWQCRDIENASKFIVLFTADDVEFVPLGRFSPRPNGKAIVSTVFDWSDDRFFQKIVTRFKQHCK